MKLQTKQSKPLEGMEYFDLDRLDYGSAEMQYNVSVIDGKVGSGSVCKDGRKWKTKSIKQVSPGTKLFCTVRKSDLEQY